MESVQTAPVAVVDNIVSRSASWTAWTVEMYIESVQRVSVVVVDSITSRNVRRVCTDSTDGCGGQDGQYKCMWSLNRQYKWLWWTALSIEMYDESAYTVPMAVVDSSFSRRVCGVSTGSTSGCGGQYYR